MDETKNQLPFFAGIVGEGKNPFLTKALSIIVPIIVLVLITLSYKKGLLVSIVFAASFIVLWALIMIARNMLARLTGYLLPWSFNSYFWRDAYLSAELRRKYRLHKANAGVSILFLVAVFIIFVLALTYVIPDPWG